MAGTVGGARRVPSRAVWTVVVAAATALGVVYWLRDVFGPLLLALAAAYVLEPLVVRLERRGHSRLLAVSVLFAAAGLAAASLLALLVAQAFHLVAWIGDPNGLVQNGVRNLVELIERHRADLPTEDLAATMTRPEFWKSIVEPAAQVLATSLGGLLSTFTLLGALVLLPVYQFYLMLELPRLWRWVTDHLPAESRARTLGVLAEIHGGFAAFLRGRVVIALLKGVLLALLLWMLGTRLAWIVGIVAGVLSIVPLAGPVLGYLLAAGVTLAGGASIGPIVLVTIVFVVAEVIENFVLTPWVMKQGVDLHPLTVLFSVVFWAAALGAFGALIAIPLTLVLKILAREFVLPSLDRLAAR